MNSTDRLEDLLRCLMHIIARPTISPEKVQEIVGTGPRQIKAYNLCDSYMTQIQISKKSHIDQGNLSNTINRWIESGIIFRIGKENDKRPLHIYPLVQSKKRSVIGRKKGKKSKPRKGRK